MLIVWILRILGGYVLFQCWKADEIWLGIAVLLVCSIAASETRMYLNNRRT